MGLLTCFFFMDTERKEIKQNKTITLLCLKLHLGLWEGLSRSALLAARSGSCLPRKVQAKEEARRSRDTIDWMCVQRHRAEVDSFSLSILSQDKDSDVSISEYGSWQGQAVWEEEQQKRRSLGSHCQCGSLA